MKIEKKTTKHYTYEKNKGTKSDNNSNVMFWIHTLFRHLIVNGFIQCFFFKLLGIWQQIFYHS